MEKVPSITNTQLEKIRAKFFEALKKEVDSLVKDGRLDEKGAAEKIAAGSKIETSFSNNPEKDARLFAISGIGSEEELLEALEGRSSKD